MKKLKRVLIANRGEIALRATQTCKRLGIETIAVYSKPDAASPHVWLSDRAFCIGPAAASESYLQGSALIHVAQRTNCDAVYPGYGFLSENPSFAVKCKKHKIKFIGPSPETIKMMGDKAMAREKAHQHNVPVVPGSEKVYLDHAKALKRSKAIGFPLLLKARAGGGGKGMRVVSDENTFKDAFQEASREAYSSFGDGALYIEKFFQNVRHVEVQILGDGKGNAIAFAERDCSVQRRHQKLIEESPSPLVDNKMRSKLLDAATALAKGIKYEGAGTIEFILDSRTNSFFFIEMNTRIQVEHPVTEFCHNIDLVEAQFRIAAKADLSPFKKFLTWSGHAIEFRINAEDWQNNFAPSPGVVRSWNPPKGKGVRIDTAIHENAVVSPYYDSMIAKLIIYAKTRKDVIDQARTAFSRFHCTGVKTTIGFHKMLLQHDAFIKNRIYTRWIESELSLNKNGAPANEP